MSSRKSSSVIFRCRSLSSELLSKTILPVCLNPSRKGTRKFWIFFLLLSSQNLDAPPPRPFFSRPNSGRHTSIVVIYCPPRLLLQTLFWYYPLVMLHFFFMCQTRAYFSTIYFLAWREPRMCLFLRFCSKNLEEEREPFLCFEDHKSCCCSNERRLYKLHKPLQIKRVMVEYSKTDLTLHSLKVTKNTSLEFSLCQKEYFVCFYFKTLNVGA